MKCVHAHGTSTLRQDVIGLVLRVGLQLIARRATSRLPGSRPHARCAVRAVRAGELVRCRIKSPQPGLLPAQQQDYCGLDLWRESAVAVL